MERRLSTAAPASGRASLGPARVRGAAGVGTTASELANMSIAKDGRRESAFGGVNENAPANSQRKLSMDPRDATPSGRRSSAFGARQSVAPGQPPLVYAGGIKDPRPIREKTYQLEVIRRLVEYLAKAGYQHPISQKILTAPSAKDFQQIFRFLYAQIDPAYDFGKKFEDEVPAAMRGIRYPFAGDISKSQLYAVGSMHAWPGLLAMLGWMVDLIEAADLVRNIKAPEGGADAMVDSPAVQDVMGDDDVPDHRAPEEVFFEYLSAAYKAFLAGADDFGGLQAELAATFARRSEATLREAERLGQEVAEAEATLTALTADAGPLARARHEHSVYAGDVEKFTKFLGHLQAKRAKFDESILAANEELHRTESYLVAAEAERAAIQAQIGAQTVCPEEIDRMNAERDALVRQLETLSAGKDEAQRVFWEREVAVQKRSDAVEKLVSEYNYAGESLGVIPAEAANAGGADLELRFNPSAARPEQIIGADLRTAIHPTLQRLQIDAHAAIHEGQETAAATQDALERLQEAAQDKRDAVTSAEHRLERLVASYLEDKDAATAEGARLDSEAEGLEDTIMRLRAEAASQALASQQRLQRAAMEHDQLVAAIAADRERAGTELYGVLDVLLSGKTSIEATLAELQITFERELSEC